MRRERWSLLAQDAGHHFLGDGLAVAAGDGHHRNGKPAAPGACQIAQRAAGVGHHHER